MPKTMTVRTTIAAILTGLSMSAHAIADTARAFNIPAGDLVVALESLAKQADIELVYQAEQLRGIRTGGVNGTYEPKEAVSLLLKGTRLTIRTDEATGVMLVAPPAAPRTSSVAPSPSTGETRAEEKKSFWSRLRLAQTDAPSPAQGAGRQPPQATELEEIVVTGTHIRGAPNRTVPLQVLSREYIESTGISTTTRLIESLPQNFALNSQAGLFVPGTTSSAEQGASINLRGIGEGTTLVLLNGRRLAPGFFGAAVDISALPLSAVERVEVVTDGASALYGSDAVGGVVNFILRKDFEGAETSLRAGTTQGSVNEYRANQVAGHAWGSGNALVSLEYYRRDLLDAQDRSFIPANSLVGSLLPQDKDISAMLSGRQSIGDALEVFADALYTRRSGLNRGGLVAPFNEENRIRNPQISATVGLGWKVPGDWRIETAGNYALNQMDRSYTRTGLAIDYDVDYRIRSAQLKADGPLFQLPAGKLQLAVGMDWRSESFTSRAAGSLNAAVDLDQTVRSLYGELLAPLVGPQTGVAADNRLELSLAGRLDDYSSFGSSFDPQVGLMWQPVRGLRLRGSYGTSYRAPALFQYDVTQNGGFAVTNVPDPGAPSGVSHQLSITGFAANDYEPQQSRNFSLGIELAPPAYPNLKLSAGYFNIRYHDILAVPPTSNVILGNPAAFASLFIRDPSVDVVNQYIALGRLGTPFTAYNYPSFSPNATFDPATVEVIIDRRTRNLSRLGTNGFDLSAQYSWQVATGTVNVGLDGTYLRERQQKVSSGSPSFDTIDTLYNPPHLRARASAGWRRAGWAANAFVNFVDSYTDNRRQPTPIASWTTVDLRIARDLNGSASQIALSAQNLLDRNPPRVAVLSLYDLAFDPTNASPLGRLLSLELRHRW